MGHLIIKTGHEALAKKIEKENNYAYIEDMNYPELLAWADEFGFEIEELKWIQPSYQCVNVGRCETGKIVHVSAYGKSDGCIGITPTPTSANAPFSYRWFRFDRLQQTWLDLNRHCDLVAGKYKCAVMDNTGKIEDFFYEILEPTATSLNPIKNYIFNIYPNPSQDYITIDTDSNTTFSLTLYDMLGLPVLSQQLVEKQTVISVAHLEKGFYNVVISDGKNRWVNKLVKY